MDIAQANSFPGKYPSDQPGIQARRNTRNCAKKQVKIYRRKSTLGGKPVKNLEIF